MMLVFVRSPAMRSTRSQSSFWFWCNLDNDALGKRNNSRREECRISIPL